MHIDFVYLWLLLSRLPLSSDEVQASREGSSASPQVMF